MTTSQMALRDLIAEAVGLLDPSNHPRPGPRSRLEGERLLQRRFALSVTEQMVIGLLVAVEISTAVSDLLPDGPTLGTIRDAIYGDDFTTAHHELSPSGALRRYGLIEVSDAKVVAVVQRIVGPVPDAAERAHLWHAMLPTAAPRAPGIDYAALGQRFELTGGYIRNAALRAAFLAASARTPITAAHLERAARLECEAMGKLAYEHDAAAAS